MSRRTRILRNIGIGLIGLIALLMIGGLLLVQTDWFRGYVRAQIVSLTEEATGGRVEVGSFAFHWRGLEAVVTDFVIHGREPQGAAPFVRVAQARVSIRLFSSFRHILDISNLEVDKPAVNILVAPDGTTNMPEPKDKKPQSDKTILDTVVDLAVDHFQLTDGVLAFNSEKQPLNVKGNNLRAQLWFNMLTQSYKGQVSLQPLYVVAGRNTPVVFTITLPVTLDRKRVTFDNAKITTLASALTINGSLTDMNHPKTDVRINGHLALSDLKALGDLPLDLSARNAPSMVDVDGNVAMADNRISVNGLRIGLGASNIEASGILKDPQGNGGLQFKARLALDEVGNMAKVAARPGGVVVANGTAKLDAANNYFVTGNVEGRDLSFLQDGKRIRDINLFTAVTADPHKVDLKGLRLSAFGGQFNGNASLEDAARYQVQGDLRNFDLQTVTRVLGQKPLPYDGVVSGPIQARGDLKAPGATGITASANLAITPGRRGVPVSGRINAEYNGATGAVNVANSYLSLPNTRLNLNGSLTSGLTIDLNTKNLNDLFAAAGPGTKPPVALAGGQAHFKGVVSGGIDSPKITGHLGVNRFSVQGRTFDSLDVDVAAAKNRAALSSGVLQRGPMQAQFEAAAGLQNWSPKPNQPLTAAVHVRNGDLADVMVLAGQPPSGYSGGLTMDANINGTIGNPSGVADLQVVNGTVKDEPFDRIQARVNLADQLVTIPAATIQAGQAQVTMKAEFRHPRDSFSTGQLHASVRSNQVDLAQLRTLQRERPNTAGLLNLDVDVTGNLAQAKVSGEETTEFLLTGVNGTTLARNLRFDGQNYGSLDARATTSGQTVNYDVTSDFAGSAIKVNGNTQLVRGYPTTADATLRNLPVERLLALAKRTDIPARGNLSGTAHVNGTMADPQGSVDLELAKAVLYDEPIDLVHARISYLAQRVDVPQFEVVAGPARLDLTARYDHPLNDLKAGNLQFQVKSNRIELARFRSLQKVRPGLGGALQLTASGAAVVSESTPQVLFQDLNADIGATGISVQGKNFGDLTAKATTNAGLLNFTLDSNLANATIHGKGNARLTGDYPVTAEVDFSNVLWSHLQPLLGPSTGQPPAFDAATDGRVTISGPATKTDEMRGTLQIAKLQVNTLQRPGSNGRPITIHNEGPIVASLDRGVVRIDSAHLVGPQTDISATGTASLVKTQSMDLTLNAKTNLALLQSFSPDIYSSGNVVVAANVRGTIQEPLMNGKIELQNASINDVDIPNGISNANGLIVLSGNTASIRNLTAESGGGKIKVTGYVTMSDTLRLGLRANATGVRVRTQPGVSVVASAFVNLTGTMKSSLASGSITINRLTYAPQSDIGSLLTRSAPPVQAPSTPNPLLDNMRFDIRIRTSSSTTVQASLAQNLQVDADLRLRGTAALPSLLGRVTITEGNLVFFGSQYRVSTGAISFFNPVRIEPVLNVTLETQAKGVNVVLTVTGPIDNMKLSYTSDPPLQFQEIVGLLASGKTPTSDPTLLANQPSTPQQSYQQMGESALVSKALADPVSSRLQRVFGVSQLKIDPSFTSGSDLPQAKVTLQQQVATNVTFTYVTSLEDPNAQTVRVEWSFSPQWSAIANRDENGLFSVNFLYKKQFR